MNGSMLKTLFARTGLLGPTLVFMALVFLLPIWTVLVQAVSDSAVHDALPATVAAIGDWDSQTAPTKALQDALVQDLRAIEDPINAAIRRDLAVSDSYMSLDDAYEERGLIRTRSVMPPPTTDGKVRIVEIAGLERQACGGTHLASTGLSGPVRILKIDNKGRRNRRIKIGLADRVGA